MLKKEIKETEIAKLWKDFLIKGDIESYLKYKKLQEFDYELGKDLESGVKGRNNSKNT